MPVITNFDQPKFFRWRGKMAGFLFTNDKVFELKEVSSEESPIVPLQTFYVEVVMPHRTGQDGPAMRRLIPH